MDIRNAIAAAASGLKAQALRMRVIAENLANQDSVAQAPGGDPYRRRMVNFRSEIDRATGTVQVATDRMVPDSAPFGKRYEPGHPAADAQGYVMTPNVNGVVEAADMAAAQRGYEANLQSIESAKALTMRTIDLLR